MWLLIDLKLLELCLSLAGWPDDWLLGRDDECEKGDPLIDGDTEGLELGPLEGWLDGELDGPDDGAVDTLGLSLGCADVDGLRDGAHIPAVPTNSWRMKHRRVGWLVSYPMVNSIFDHLHEVRNAHLWLGKCWDTQSKKSKLVLHQLRKHLEVYRIQSMSWVMVFAKHCRREFIVHPKNTHLNGSQFYIWILYRYKNNTQDRKVFAHQLWNDLITAPGMPSWLPSQGKLLLHFSYTTASIPSLQLLITSGIILSRHPNWGASIELAGLTLFMIPSGYSRDVKEVVDVSLLTFNCPALLEQSLTQLIVCHPVLVRYRLVSKPWPSICGSLRISAAAMAQRMKAVERNIASDVYRHDDRMVVISCRQLWYDGRSSKAGTTETLLARRLFKRSRYHHISGRWSWESGRGVMLSSSASAWFDWIVVPFDSIMRHKNWWQKIKTTIPMYTCQGWVFLQGPALIPTRGPGGSIITSR